MFLLVVSKYLALILCYTAYAGPLVLDFKTVIIVFVYFSWGHSGYKELYPDEFLERKSNEIVSDERYTFSDLTDTKVIEERNFFFRQNAIIIP